MCFYYIFYFMKFTVLLALTKLMITVNFVQSELIKSREEQQRVLSVRQD